MYFKIILNFKVIVERVIDPDDNIYRNVKNEWVNSKHFFCNLILYDAALSRTLSMTWEIHLLCIIE